MLATDGAVAGVGGAWIEIIAERRRSTDALVRFADFFSITCIEIVAIGIESARVTRVHAQIRS